MIRDRESDDELTAFVRRNLAPVPMPAPGHVEQTASAMRAQATRRARYRVFRDAGVVAAAVAASLLLYFTNMRQPAASPLNHNAERILAESFSGIVQGEADNDAPAYEAFAP